MTVTITREAGEETPLLQVQLKKRTPLPWSQFTIVFFLQLGESLTSQVISPFAPQLIRDLGIANGNESKVGYYVGIMQSLYFLAQTFTVLHWSRLSDHVGRKPVILIGLFGLSSSMYCLGLSRTFVGLVLSRALNGALDGNIGVIKSTMAELTDSTNIAQAYAKMPIAWCMGNVIGPMIGGSLARPAERLPSLFGNNEFLKKYPYFLPCAIPATYTACAWLLTFVFLKDTVKHPVPFRSLLNSKIQQKRDQKALTSPEPNSDDDGESAEKPPPLRLLLTSRLIILVGANYAFLALVGIAFHALQPVFFSTPVELGGLGLPPSVIGNILSVSGVISGFFQVFFAKIHDHWGSKKVFIGGIASTLPLFVSFPLINHLARTQGFTPVLWFVVGCQVVLSIFPGFSYGAIFIFITASAPNRASLGATNGICQMAVSVMRTIGPAAANSLFSFSIEHRILGGFFVYFVLMSIVVIALLVASMLPSAI